eukprot:jgi/Ulvmu1/11145/UM071_0029.1
MTPSMPFIMPDGRRLTQLMESGETEKTRSTTKKGRKRQQGCAVNLKLEPHNEYEAQEFAAAAKLGARSRLRWANDRLLRQLAGPMTAQDMVNLFSPPPFGESKESALQEALRAAPDLWGRLRNVDMDKEALMLQKWREHNATHRRGGKQVLLAGGCRGNAANAVAAWSSVGRKGRAALRKLDIHRVHVLEEHVGQFMAAGDAEAAIKLEDGFERCAMHGLAAFHGLLSHGVTAADGARAVRLRRPAPATTLATHAAAPATAEQIPTASAIPRRSSGSRSRSCARASSGARHTAASAAAATTSEASGNVHSGLRRSSLGPGDGVVAAAADPACAAGLTKGAAQAGGSALFTVQHACGGAATGGGGAPEAGHAATVLPFTAVDVLMVLHEDTGGAAGAGGPVGGLTAAALKQHREEHLPPELAGSW